MALCRLFLAGPALMVTLIAGPASFRLPQAERFVPVPTVTGAPSVVRQSAEPLTTIAASPEGVPDEEWIFTDRVALELEPGVAVESVLRDRPLTISRLLRPDLLVLQAPDAATAWQQAEELSREPGVRSAYPVHHAPKAQSDGYAAAPNDDFFRAQVSNIPGQWYLENRDPETGVELGADINVRPAWAVTRGAGVIVAVADSGIEQGQVDLKNQVRDTPQFNFSTGLPDGAQTQTGSRGAHGTSCAGLIAAEANNRFGMTGVAPDARVAGWVIYDSKGRSVTDERLGDVFRYASNVVAVQNHSWGPAGAKQRGPSALEAAGLNDAWTQGRGGLGTVMVFAAGNDRQFGVGSDDNGFSSDPRTISVAAVQADGRALSSSEPGASLLVAAPSGDDDSGGLFTTDLSGIDGANFISFFPPDEYLSDFRWGALGFKHTSAAAPLVSGVAALVLSVNPALTARDVQQVLLLSARHFDLTDPGLATNRAGLRVSHNVGFGVVDAGAAVSLARQWSNRPATIRITAEAAGPVVIPDGGLRVEARSETAPLDVSVFTGLPGTGVQADVPSGYLPLASLGLATNPPAGRLDGQGALIERGEIGYAEKVTRAGAAGAAFAIVYNSAEAAEGTCPGGEQLCVPGGTDFAPIPVIFIRRSAGLALEDGIRTNAQFRAQLRQVGATLRFAVTNAVQCEHVGVRVRTDHTVRGDLRITLRSPGGTLSVLQRYNADTGPGPVDWTYWTTHHFYESSVGEWELTVTDQAEGEGTGSVLGATLVLDGVPINDSDHDGLDDGWELAHLATLAQGPADDPDADGASNLRESLVGTDPLRDDQTGAPDVGFFSDRLVRVSWPGNSGKNYALRSGGSLSGLDTVTNVPGAFPVTSALVPVTAGQGGFFRVEGAVKP